MTRYGQPDIAPAIRVIAYSSALLFVFFFAYVLMNPTPTHYTLVVDCGSSGTRLYVYQWMGGVFKGSGYTRLPQLKVKGSGLNYGRGKFYDRKETEPGLDQFLGDPTGLRDRALGPLLEWGTRLVPRSKRSLTPIFVLATAGLRRLPEADREWVLSKTREILHSSPFRFKDEWVKTISGVDEAVYGWMGLNYKSGLLEPEASRKTLGALDLGGSSLEVTYQVEGSGSQSESLANVVGLSGAQYSLFAKSFSGFGMNDAFDRSVAALLPAGQPGESVRRSTDGMVNVSHPCLHSGYKSTHTLKGSGQHVVNLVGSPDWSSCQKLARSMVADAGGGGSGWPRPQGDFVGLSGFYVVHRFFQLDKGASLAGAGALEGAARKFCGRPWEEVKFELGNVYGVDRYCFRAPYVLSLLREGLGFRNDQVHVVEGDVSWTLGAALILGGPEVLKGLKARDALVNFGLLSSSDEKETVETLILWVGVVVLVLFVGGGLTWRYLKKRRALLFGGGRGVGLPTRGSPLGANGSGDGVSGRAHEGEVVR